MRIPFWRRRSARRQTASILSTVFTISSLSSLPTTDAIQFTPAPSANLDLSQLGRVGIAGDFSGLSLFQFQQQTETPFSTNGSESLLARMPNGALASVINTDASITAMCTFILGNGSMSGVVLGGNFTSLGSMRSPAIALFNPNSSEIIPLPGLEGNVAALLCDQERNTVYVGGNFKGGGSTNAISWVSNQWTNLPFAGFNGPVRSITKASNGHIIFGGSFTGLGNDSTPSQPDGQVINLSTASITAGSSATIPGFSDPRNIICKTSGIDGAGNTWLLQDGSTGFWQAGFNFGFQPTKLRLRNTHQGGRGTRTWRFTAQPINGIMNFTYIDPATGANRSCTSECPLSSNTSVPFQDFHFVNVIGMNGFRIDISAFHGSGGGLNGIELFQNDVFAYAINDFNEPTCASLSTPSRATVTGPFTVSASLQSQSQYLTAQLSSPVSSSSASVVFTPDIRDSGNYSVNMYTPGCMPDFSCGSRGQVNVTINSRPGVFQSVQLFQTNNFDKYDQIFFGPIQASGSFRPTVTLTPVGGQSLSTMTFVAQRVGFTQINSTGGLNGIYDFNPASATLNPADFEASAFHKLGSSLSGDATVVALATAGDITYIGGSFDGDNARNVVGVNSADSTARSLNGGLNGAVASMALNGTSLYVGGSFSATADNSLTGLNNVAVLNTATNTWSPLGGGVQGTVRTVVLMTMNITSTTPEVVVSFTGNFNQLLAFSGNAAVDVDGFAIWVPSQRNWLDNLSLAVESVQGMLSTSILNVPGADVLYAGSVRYSSLEVTGAVTLADNAISRFPVRIQEGRGNGSSSSLTKRDTPLSRGLSGVYTGAFYAPANSGRNITVLAGHFTATATNGSSVDNVVFVDGANNDNVSGLGSQISASSTFVAVAIQGDSLFAGGNVTGTVNGASVRGLVSYNLASGNYNIQPPALSGGNTSVSAIAVRPNSADVYVGGSFTLAGSLGCPGVCFYSTSSSVWNRPGNNLAGTVNCMIWASDSVLLAGGSVTLNDTIATPLVRFDTGRQTWDNFPGSDRLPGPAEVITPASSDGSQIWVAGTSRANGSIYLMKYDGSQWLAGQALGSGTVIRSLQMFTLTSNHDSTPLVAENQVLMLTGSINIPGFGTASAVIFNGSSYRPFALTSTENNTPGSISRVFVQNSQFFSTTEPGRLPLVAIVLIGLGISLVLMLLIVLAGLFLDRLRKRREGYVPAPTSMYDRGSGIQRIPPGELLSSLSKGRPGAPTV